MIKTFRKPHAAHKYSEGYMAITSSIIIFGFVISLALAIGLGSFFMRENIASSYYKSISHSLADACADVALLKLANDINYTGGEIILVGDDACEIVNIFSDGGEKVLYVRGESVGAVTNFVIRTNENDLTITRWEEVVELQ